MICLKIRTFVVSATTDVLRRNNSYLLWFAWKFVPLWYQQQRAGPTASKSLRCDLLENSYLCGISNNNNLCILFQDSVVICLKIRTFVVSATTHKLQPQCLVALWFAWKFVPLWYQQQLFCIWVEEVWCCDLLENSYLCGISNNRNLMQDTPLMLWFAWKFVPLWYQQQLFSTSLKPFLSCDLLENSYLCGISNNSTDGDRYTQ